MIVVDNNLIVAFAVKLAETKLAQNIQSRDRDWIAPAIWESEFRQVMLTLIKGGKLGHQTALAAYAYAHGNVQTYPVATGAVLRIAELHGLTAYDAEYVALAEWLEVPCLSFDSDLLKSGLATHPEDF